MSEVTYEKLHELCASAVEYQLVYSCGETLKYETYDFNKGAIEPVPPKPWFVKTTANEPEQYFTNEELYEYLTQLMSRKSK
ncbi:MAG TPA: hypothetical protein VK203_15410 [Nostocaceae cyanobacterium]|nr:hypothetical protein [Nostocaceae cyanobacterium]